MSVGLHHYWHQPLTMNVGATTAPDGEEDQRDPASGSSTERESPSPSEWSPPTPFCSTPTEEAVETPSWPTHLSVLVEESNAEKIPTPTPYSPSTKKTV